jgi:aminoglycoside phosphotransferase (APT) family kinase protein
MRIDRQQAFSGTTASDIDGAALESHLAKHLAGFAGPLSLARFKGGQSNPTYKLTTPGRSYVLRRKPFGRLLPSAHAIEREYRVTAALGGAGFPVAKPLHLCTDDSVIGAAFYIMEHADGRVFWEPHAPGLPGDERAALFASLNDTIARLHGLDAAALGLADFGRPQGYVARQIRRWAEQYRTSETERIAAMDRLIDWLPGACPADSGAAIVHGDFRLDNCIIHPAEPRVIAVLDW